nr:gmc oxidoreductase [Pandoravirus massiliensis]
MHQRPDGAAWLCRQCVRRNSTRSQSRYVTPKTHIKDEDDGDGGGDTAAYDYIVVGAGAAGSAHARALSDDPTVSVLVLDWGPDRRADATAADLLRGVEAAHDPGTSIRIGGAAEPGLLGARCALGGGRAVGGSTLVDSALWGTGGPREWRDFAKACKRAGPKRGGADTWMTRLAAAASVPLARVEAYIGPCDAPLGGAPSSSSTASANVPYSNNNGAYNAYDSRHNPRALTSAYPRRPWDPGGDARAHRLFVSYGMDGDRRGGQRRYDFQEAAGAHAERSERMGDEGDEDAPDWPVRGTRGRVTVRALAPAWDALSDSFVQAAGRVYGVREVVDHNGPSPFGVTRHVQFAVRLGHPHGFNRQPAGDAFVGSESEGERCVACGHRRRLVVIGGALVERVVFEMPTVRSGPVASPTSQRRGRQRRTGRDSDHHHAGQGHEHDRHRREGHRRHGDMPPAATAKPRAIGVIYLERGVRPVRVRARRRVILCASALNPAVLQRSGIGDPRLLAGIGTRVVFANAAVGAGYHCPYGFRMVASVTPLARGGGSGTAPPDVRSDLNPPGTIGMVLAQDATRPSRRRRQWCVLAAAGPLPDYWPVAGDPLVRAASRWAPFGMQSAAHEDDDDDATHKEGKGEGTLDRSTSAADAWCAPPAYGSAVVTFSAWLLDPTSRGGAIETPSSDPSVLPRARLGLYTDGADMQSMRALARSVMRLIDTMPATTDGHHLTLAHPTPEVVSDDGMLDLWLRTEAFYVAHRHGGVCRVGPSPDHQANLTCGVVDGLLCVHGVDGLSVCDSTVFDHGMGVGTTAGTAAILATAYADMLLDGIVDGARATDGRPTPGNGSRRGAMHEPPLPMATARHRPPQTQRQPVRVQQAQGRPAANPAGDRLFVRITQHPHPPPPPASQPPASQPPVPQRHPQRQENPHNVQQTARAARPNPLHANHHPPPPGRSAFAFMTAPASQDNPKVAPPALVQRRRHR